MVVGVGRKKDEVCGDGGGFEECSKEVEGVRGVDGRIKPGFISESLQPRASISGLEGWRNSGRGGVRLGGVRLGGVGSSSVVLYLPGCVRVCGGVLWGDAPRCRGVLLGLLGLCCCLKKGLSTRPGIIHTTTQPHTHTSPTRKNMTEEDRPRKRGERQRRPHRIMGKRSHEKARKGEEKVEKKERKKKT